MYTNPVLADFNESRCDTMFNNITVTAGDIISAINSLDDSVKSGPNLVPPAFIKRCPPIGGLVLTLLNKWKTAYLYPMFKKGDKQNVEYRSISI